ncbi:unnamed protein product [Linum grandiflorum]
MNTIGGGRSRWFSVLYPIVLAAMLMHSIADDRKIHVVYMGDLPNDGVTSAHHVSLLENVLGSASLAKESLVYSYGRSFNGFAAKLSPQEVAKFSKMERVVSVIPNRIWPESQSFNDEGMTPTPARWRGECHPNITCNNKIIGARYYNSDGIYDEKEFKSPRDAKGHGSHTSSIAAGREVPGVSFFGLAEGTATGGVPNARIAVYKVCWLGQNCGAADILAGFDDAIADGVDILSASIGVGPPSPPFFEDPVAIGAFHAMKHGVLTSASAGNDGPNWGSSTNLAPWILTVAASTIDRKFVTKLVLGNGQTFIGSSLDSFVLDGVTIPLVWAGDVANYSSGHNALYAQSCLPDGLDSNKAAGNIILCNGEFADFIGAMMANGAAAILPFPHPYSNDVAYTYPFPTIRVSRGDCDAILEYIRTTKNPIATILSGETLKDVMSPSVVSFSSRGPNRLSPEILKPDITAPGVDILAAWSPVAPPSSLEEDTRVVHYNVISGTSMSCPHVSGVAAYVKAIHPEWSPAAIKSAIMTTASPMDPRKNNDGEFAYGAGHINPMPAADPGLVYDASESDYIHYLCKQGYNATQINLVTGRSNASCDGVVPGRAWDLNYPTFGLAVEDGQPINATFTRTVTNVGSANSTYQVTTQMPDLVTVEVSPQLLSFSAVGEKKTFTVKVSGPKIVEQPIMSGAIAWVNGVRAVRSPLVVYTITPNSAMAGSQFMSTDHKSRFRGRPTN